MNDEEQPYEVIFDPETGIQTPSRDESSGPPVKTYRGLRIRTMSPQGWIIRKDDDKGDKEDKDKNKKRKPATPGKRPSKKPSRKRRS